MTQETPLPQPHTYAVDSRSDLYSKLSKLSRQSPFLLHEEFGIASRSINGIHFPATGKITITLRTSHINSYPENLQTFDNHPALTKLY